MVSNPQISGDDAVDGTGEPSARPPVYGGSVTAAAARRRAWIVSLAIFGLGSALLLWAFRLEIGTAVALWSSSETYGYAFFVLPIVIFLMVRKRDLLAQMPPRAAPWGLLPAAGLAALWILGDLANVMVIQQLAFVGLWQTLFLTIMGWRITRAVLFPLAYLIMAVPLGSEIIPQLQTITAQQVIHLLRATGMPVFLDGYYIQIPSGSFLVAEACAGLHFLIVSIALGLLIAYLFFRSWPKRLLFVALSVIVPVVANGLRAYGIIMLAHLSDYRLAADVDHIVYGFVFLSFVILIMIGIASMMRDPALPAEKTPPATPVSGAPTSGAPSSCTPVPAGRPWRIAAQTGCAAAVLALVVLGQIWSGMAKAPPAGPLNVALQGPTPVAGWVAVDGKAPGWTAQFAAPDAALAIDYTDGTAEVDLQAAYYAYQREGAEALSELNTQMVGQTGWQVVNQRNLTVRLGDRTLPLTQQIIKNRDGLRLVWYWYRIGGSPTNSRIMGKALEMKATFLGQQRGAFVVAISTGIVEEEPAAAAHLERFLQTNLEGAAGLVQVRN
ncbi:MAG: exosortase A [Kiloniellaceae bacterium]